MTTASTQKKNRSESRNGDIVLREVMSDGHFWVLATYQTRLPWHHLLKRLIKSLKNSCLPKGKHELSFHSLSLSRVRRKCSLLGEILLYINQVGKMRMEGLNAGVRGCPRRNWTSPLHFHRVFISASWSVIYWSSWPPIDLGLKPCIPLTYGTWSKLLNISNFLIS